MAEAVIVSSVRTPVGRGYKGSLRTSRPDDLAALVIKEALARVPGLDPKEIDDVILGCAMPEGEQGMNVARIAALRAGLPVETSAMTVNRFCASGSASHCPRRRTNSRRLRSSHRRRRHRIHVAGAHGRQQNFAQSLARGSLSRRLHQYGPRNGESCAQIWYHARAGRSVRRRFPQKSRRCPRRR